MSKDTNRSLQNRVNLHKSQNPLFRSQLMIRPGLYNTQASSHEIWYYRADDGRFITTRLIIQILLTWKGASAKLLYSESVNFLVSAAFRTAFVPQLWRNLSIFSHVEATCGETAAMMAVRWHRAVEKSPQYFIRKRPFANSPNYMQPHYVSIK